MSDFAQTRACEIVNASITFLYLTRLGLHGGVPYFLDKPGRAGLGVKMLMRQAGGG